MAQLQYAVCALLVLGALASQTEWNEDEWAEDYALDKALARYGETPAEQAALEEAANAESLAQAQVELENRLPAQNDIENKVPMMFVNGLTGTKLTVTKLDKPSVVRPYCTKKSDEPFEIWPSTSALLPGRIHCTFDNLALEWDDNKKEYIDRGVTIEPDLSKDGTSSWGGWTYILNRTFAYRDEHWDVCGYDWRLGPRQWKSSGGAFDLCSQRVEQLYTNNNNRKVMLSSISMGGPFTKIWLENKSQQWKDTFIAGWISMSGVFGGSTELLQAQIAGDPAYQSMGGFTVLGKLITWINLAEFSGATENWGGQVVLLPFLTGDATADAKTLVSTPSRNYTVGEMRQVLLDSGRVSGTKVYDDVMQEQMKQEHPGVPFWCYIGTHMKTIDYLTYDDKFYQPDADVNGETSVGNYGNGDATVQADSLDACKYWSHPTYSTSIKHFYQVAHAPMLFNPSALMESVLDLSSVIDGDPLASLRTQSTPNVTYT
jgi:hypothetical protein